MSEINYDRFSVMNNGYPEIKKLGACSPYGEMTPFVFGGRLYRLELTDNTRGLAADDGSIGFLIRDIESGKVISRGGKGHYYFSGLECGDIFYIFCVESKNGGYSGDTVKLFVTKNLVDFEERVLFRREGFNFFNTAPVRDENGFVLAVEANEPKELVGVPFTCFFARSADLIRWDFLPDETAYPRHRYIGGPCMKYSEGWYYLFGVTELPCARYTNYLCRTKDFYTWEVGKYNPFLMPSNEDKRISPRAADFSEEFLEQIKTGFNINNSDVDMCDYNGKTYINYTVGNQLGFYYMCEAEYDGSMAELLERFFD